MTEPRIVPITDLAALRAAGIHYPASVDAWRWLYRMRHERGLDRAFRRIGRRVCVDIPTFIAILRTD